MGIASIILGVSALGLCWVPVLNLILSILGLIFGIICISQENKKASAQYGNDINGQYNRPNIQSQQQNQANQLNQMEQQNQVNNQQFQGNKQNQQNSSKTSDKKIAGIVGVVMSSIAIIISIVVVLTVGLGLLIYNSAKEASKSYDLNSETDSIYSNSINNSTNTDDKSNLNSLAKDTYNAQFEAYAGEISGSSAKALCEIVKNHDINADNSEEIVTLIYDGKSATSSLEINSIKSQLNVKNSYTIVLSYNSTSGYVDTITINKK